MKEIHIDLHFCDRLNIPANKVYALLSQTFDLQKLCRDQKFDNIGQVQLQLLWVVFSFCTVIRDLVIRVDVAHKPFKGFEVALNAKLEFALLRRWVYFGLQIFHVLHYQLQIAFVVLRLLLIVVYHSNQQLFVFEVLW